MSWRGESEPGLTGEVLGEGGGTRDTLLEDGYRYFLFGELELDIQLGRNVMFQVRCDRVGTFRYAYM